MQSGVDGDDMASIMDHSEELAKHWRCLFYVGEAKWMREWCAVTARSLWEGTGVLGQEQL